MSLTREQLRYVTKVVLAIRAEEAATIEKRKQAVQMSIFRQWEAFIRPFLLKAAEAGQWGANIPAWVLPPTDIPDLKWYFDQYGSVHDAIVLGMSNQDIRVAFYPRDPDLNHMAVGPVNCSWGGSSK